MPDLLAHIGFAHRWASAYVATGLETTVAEPNEEEILVATPDDIVVVNG